MLSVSKAIKAGQGDYYLSLSSTDDYYLTGFEPKGYWLGSGIGILGVAGELKNEDFRSLLRGFSPGSEDGSRKKMVKNAGSDRRAGWDLTWSAPKSVSVAWSQADPETREKIEGCMRRAVAAGLRYVEDTGVVIRRGEDGIVHEKAKLSFACFLHSTSRAQDPQLHIHSVLLNVGVRPDGTTGTIDPRAVYRHQMAAGALFRAELSLALEQDLGLRSRRDKWSFELLGVDPELIGHFSKRRAAIEAFLREHALSGAKASEIAAFETREKKEARPREELFDEWQQIGKNHNWSTKELSWMLNAPFPPRNRNHEVQAASIEAVKLATKRAYFPERELTRAVAESCQARGLGAEDTLTITRGLLSSKELVRLPEENREIMWTTKEILTLEQKLMRATDTMTKREANRTDDPEPESNLSPEQQNALRHVTQSLGGIKIVDGLAGTGKSTLFATAYAVWKNEGLDVHGCALSGKAALGLQEATRIPCTTIHRTIFEIENHLKVFGKNSVLVVDEAAMVGTRQLYRLTELCQEAGATLILSGDPRQLQSITFGGMFSEMKDRIGSCELVGIQRQKEPWAREAVRDLAVGRTNEAFEAYSRHGFVVEAMDTIQAVEKLVADWKQDAMVNPKASVIIASTNQDAGSLNRWAQSERQLAGLVSNSGVKIGDEMLCSGDRVLFTRNSPALSVFNGELATVKATTGHQLQVELDSGCDIVVDAKTYPHLKLGYAMTTHKAQGATFDNAFILAGASMTDREMIYVQGSRARLATRWYLVDDLRALLPRMLKSHQQKAAISLEPALELTLSR